MLKLIENLRQNNDVKKLTEELALNVYYHPQLPLIGFKYDQIESPKTHPIVREARGVVLEIGTYNLVAKGFSRFFNYGEVQEEFKTFDFTNFTASIKHDGSLILLYHYQDAWHVNTSGSFPGDNKIHSFDIGWVELFWRIVQDKLKLDELNPSCTYVFEMCSLFNKVVRSYAAPIVYLLAIFQNSKDVSVEWQEEIVDAVAAQHGLPRPQRWHLTSDKDAKELLEKLNYNDPTFEGLVIKDSQNLRYKWKTDSYLALHHKFSNGNLFLPDRLVDVARSGEITEVVTYFPEAKEVLFKVSDALVKNYESLMALWQENKHLSNRKEFAVKVVEKKHPAGSLMFRMYEKFILNKADQDENSYLKSIWNDIPGKKLVEMFPEIKKVCS